MNGAQALIRALTELGVDVAFMNPGTSEMHFVAALDAVPEMRGVLALFEGVATGAADGYGRMADHPAATLLHLGPGLGNGLANLHNARRAHTPVVNIVGDHATYHKAYDPQLESDIETVARNVSSFVRRSERADDVVADAQAAVAAVAGPARSGGHAHPAGRRVLVGTGDAAPVTDTRSTACLVRCVPASTPTGSRRWPRSCARANRPRCSWAGGWCGARPCATRPR